MAVMHAFSIPGIGVVAGLVLIHLFGAPAQDRDLPDPSMTPGVTNPSVDQDDIEQTICVPGWSETQRPPSQVTSRIKRRQLDAGYQSSRDMRRYREDHLVPLELGGAPAEPANLWPEPVASSKMKDVLEDRLHFLVCTDQVTLRDAQRAIETNWIEAYGRYVQ
jgi:hypothetical protein